MDGFRAWWVFLILIYFNTFSVLGQVGFPYCETFQGNDTQSNTVFGADAQLVGNVLRLTSNEEFQRGYVYVDIPFSSIFGIKASFEYFSYGGTGADGISFFLYDANIPNFTIGGFGGSLGYSKRNQEQGLAGAYLGIGFDEYGSFGNTGEGRTGGFPGLVEGEAPDAVVIRGPGNGFTGYEFIAGRRTMEAGPFGLPADQQFPISSGGPGTNRVTDPNQPGYRKVFINLEPNPNDVGYLITVEMQFTTAANNSRLISIFEQLPYPFEAPENLKLGFAASTGGSTNFHEIRNLIVEVSNDDGLLDPEGVDFSDKASCEGQENTYFITDEEVVLPNPNSQIRCLQFYASLDDIEVEEADICSQGRCREENRELVLPEGTFRASGEGGDFTFFPNDGFTDQSVTVYYTITDSYGKTSEGNAMTLVIQESPDPVTLQRVDGEESQDSIRLCPEEEIQLEALGDEEYERFEWYKDGVLIPDEGSERLWIQEAGTYEVIVYNRKNCPATSNPIFIAYPDFPIPELNLPLIGCEPNQSVDGLSAILDLDLERFDYRLTKDDIELHNEEIVQIAESGTYQLETKHKDLDCYGPPIEFEVLIYEEELRADFDFEVLGTGIKGDADGGIFADDTIQFTNLSDERGIQWEWNFRPGATSEEENPFYIFGERETFEVELLITDENGCQASVVKVISITKSYRLMFPTGFTPTEETNEVFVPKYKGIVEAELLIFNTWGELIFQSNSLNALGWDGKPDGVLLDAGTYVYRFNGTSVDGESVKESGKFKLIR
ncbi:C-terminal domain of CHU protein family protein [Algoriphagus faecimaris]|uniref:C-terminal domain of CHU protein family protein n=1 Tax=Algoriphagus faecimaris TaxID=686796 RepID=A0A1G6W1N9_9BACT|nr:gliding motility-associated C-terminal domain-containing protein [Algoriphagus faecimaris]SDD58966.1 C-terminal domain of CHU protein family protein [Algoriphagus faecimaris]